jgi:hypothetical protein
MMVVVEIAQPIAERQHVEKLNSMLPDLHRFTVDLPM